jgi:hypothetical protein
VRAKPKVLCHPDPVAPSDDSGDPGTQKGNLDSHHNVAVERSEDSGSNWSLSKMAPIIGALITAAAILGSSIINARSSKSSDTTVPVGAVSTSTTTSLVSSSNQPVETGPDASVTTAPAQVIIVQVPASTQQGQVVPPASIVVTVTVLTPIGPPTTVPGVSTVPVTGSTAVASSTVPASTTGSPTSTTITSVSNPATTAATTSNSTTTSSVASTSTSTSSTAPSASVTVPVVTSVPVTPTTTKGN